MRLLWYVVLNFDRSLHASSCVLINCATCSSNMQAIWDCFLLEGEPLLCRVTLALLKLSEAELLQAQSLEDAMKILLRRLPDTVAPATVIRAASQFSIDQVRCCMPGADLFVWPASNLEMRGHRMNSRQNCTASPWPQRCQPHLSVPNRYLLLRSPRERHLTRRSQRSRKRSGHHFGGSKQTTRVDTVIW